MRNPDGGLEAWVTVPIIDAYGELQLFEAIVDTGFTGWLTLPESDIRRLGLVHAGHRYSITASGNAERFEFYRAWVSWHDQLYWVEVFQSIDQPLLGMELLEGSNVALDAREGGEVIIEEVGSGLAT
ncbi:MAG: clan AA aspartic protease [Chloroflexi bacterium]|nr:clan AA aspartic protease [Chloroflexota bacterium]